MFITESGLIPVVRTYTFVDRGSSSFDIVDNKGRPIGHRWVIQHVTNEPVTEEAYRDHAHHGYVRPGELLNYYEVRCHVTRNGQGFGASQPCTKVETYDQAHDVIHARRKTSRAYNSKKFAEFNRRAG